MIYTRLALLPVRENVPTRLALLPVRENIPTRLALLPVGRRNVLRTATMLLVCCKASLERLVFFETREVERELFLVLRLEDDDDINSYMYICDKM